MRNSARAEVASWRSFGKAVIAFCLLIVVRTTTAQEIPPENKSILDAEKQIRAKGYLAPVTQSRDKRMAKFVAATASAKNKGNSPALRYALFEALYKESVQLGRADLLVQIASDWRADFAVNNGDKLVPEGIRKILASPQPPAARAESVMGIVSEAQKACVRDDWPSGLELIELLMKSNLAGAVRDYTKSAEAEIVEGYDRWKSIQASASKRAAVPPDPQAQADFAMFLIFVKYDEPTGIAALPATDVNEVVASLRAEANAATNPTVLLAIAEKWLDLSRAARIPEKNWFIDRAHRVANRSLRLSPDPDLARIAAIRKERARAFGQDGPAFFSRRPLDAIPFGGHWYKFFRESLTWNQAAEACEKIGGRLVCIETKEENTFISTLLGAVESSRYPPHSWIGGTDRQVEGEFIWLSLQPFRPMVWGDGQPDVGAAGAEQDYLYARWEKDKKAAVWGDIFEDGYRTYVARDSREPLIPIYYICEWDI